MSLMFLPQWAASWRLQLLLKIPSSGLRDTWANHLSHLRFLWLRALILEANIPNQPSSTVWDWRFQLCVDLASWKLIAIISSSLFVVIVYKYIHAVRKAFDNTNSWNSLALHGSCGDEGHITVETCSPFRSLSSLKLESIAKKLKIILFDQLYI